MSAGKERDKGVRGGGDIPWVATVIAEKEKGDDAKVSSILVPRIALLKDSKVTQDQTKAGDTIIGLQTIAQRCPSVFAVKGVVDECLRLLGWSSGLSAPRDGIVQHQITCSLLLAGHKNLDLWPTSLVKAYLDDALQGRRWVDIQNAAVLVANIVTAFPNVEASQATAADRETKGVAGKDRSEPDAKRRKLSNSALVGAGAEALAAASDRPGQSFYAEESGCDDDEKETLVRLRYRNVDVQREVAKMALDAVKKSLDEQPSGESNMRKLQNVLRVLLLLVCYEPVRYEVMKRLEVWVNNPNLVRHLKELMPRLASQCTETTQMENETIRHMLRMRPKANAVQMHNEAFGLLCRANRDFPLRAFFYLLQIEMTDYDSFVHKSNKALKCSQYIGTILKNSGVPYLTAKRQPEMGGGIERFNVVDLGLGKLEYEAEGVAQPWSKVMKAATHRGIATSGDAEAGAASGLVLVATEEEVCEGSPEQDPASRVLAAARRARDENAAGLVVVLSPGALRAVPRSWTEGDLKIPVLALVPGDNGTSMEEVAATGVPLGRKCALQRFPREAMLARCIQTLADDRDKRAGLPLLLRKVLKTCQMGSVAELDLVALCNALMSLPENHHTLDSESKYLWASALVDVVCFACIHLGSQVVEAGQASVHAERGGGALETRSERAALRMRGQVMSIQESLLDTWMHDVLKTFLPRERLAQALRKLLFYEDASSYSVEPLVLEIPERQGVKALQTEMAASQRSLVALARLGLSTDTASRAVDPALVLELIEMVVRRAMPVACRRALALSKADEQGGQALAQAALNRNLENLALTIDGVALWEDLVTLARSCGEELHVLRGKELGRHRDLAPRARVWQAYLIITLLTVINPNTLGKVVWSEVPTIRVMLQVLITNVFEFPPVTTDNHLKTGVRFQAAMANTEELDLIHELKAKLAEKDVAEPKCLETSTMIKPRGTVRQTPKETLVMLKVLDKSHDLGHLLRMSREPDMLLETIGAHGSDSAACVAWLGGVLRRYPATANLLPVVTICQLLLANLSSVRSTSVKSILGYTDGRFSHIVPLAMRLAECLHEQGGDEADMEVEGKHSQEWESVLFFLDFLGDENEHNARTAVKALGLVLVCLEKIRGSHRDSRVCETIMVSSSVQDDTGSGEEEELLAGGGEEELLAGGGDDEVEMLAGGGVAVREPEAGKLNRVSPEQLGTAFEEHDSKFYDDDDGPAGGSMLWLRLLMEIQGVPACVHDKLLLRLRRALMTETEVEILMHYLEHLSQVKHVCTDALARDVADLVLRRKVLVHYLSKLPGATSTLTRIMIVALTEGSDGEKSGSCGDLVRIPGSSCKAPLPVLRAALQTLCLLSTEKANDGNGALKESNTAHRDQLVRLLLPTKASLKELELSDEEILCLLQSNCEHVVACAVATATIQQLVRALGLSGMSTKSLAAIVARMMELPGGSMPPMAQTLRGGFAARAVSMLRGEHAREANWLSDMLGIHLKAPKKMSGPQLSRPHASQTIDVSAHQASSTPHMDLESIQLPAARKASAQEAVRGPLLRVPAKTLLAACVEADESASDGDGQVKACEGGAIAHCWRWGSVVNALVEGEEEVKYGECGVQMDFLAAVNPLLWSHLSKGEHANAAFFEKMFKLRSSSAVAWGSFKRRTRVPSCHAALAGPLVLGGSHSYLVCRRWLLGATKLNPSTGGMHSVRSEAGPDVLGPELDCDLCLQVLSTCITGESGPLEGTWGEGGGGEVLETRTRRENMGLAPSLRLDSAGGAPSEAECVTMAHFIVSEGSTLGGFAAMGRMQLLVLLLRGNQPAALAVNEALLQLIALHSGRIPSDGLRSQDRVAQAAADVYDRLLKALPMPMSSVVIANSLSGCSAHGAPGVWDAPWIERIAGGSQQTSRLDRLLHNTMTALQHEDRAAPALHVARQLAAAQPSLVANRMLLLKGMCAGKVLLSLSDFVERGHHELMLNVLAVLQAAAPHSLRSCRLPLVLDEFFLLFSSIVRYEATLEPLLLHLSRLLLQLVQLGGAASEYVCKHLSLLAKLAGWYLNIPELTAVLDLLDSEAPTARRAPVLMIAVDPEASRLEQIAAILRLRRGADGHGHIEFISKTPGGDCDRDGDIGVAGSALMQALGTAEVLTGSDVQADLRSRRLHALEGPLMDLLMHKAARVREAAFRLLLRSALISPCSSSRLGERHIECLVSDDEAVRKSAIAHSAEITLASTVAAPRVLHVLFRLARMGDADAKEELLRATRAGLDFHCIQSR